MLSSIRMPVKPKISSWNWPPSPSQVGPCRKNDIPCPLSRAPEENSASTRLQKESRSSWVSFFPGQASGDRSLPQGRPADHLVRCHCGGKLIVSETTALNPTRPSGSGDAARNPTGPRSLWLRPEKTPRRLQSLSRFQGFTRPLPGTTPRPSMIVIIWFAATPRTCSTSPFGQWTSTSAVFSDPSPKCNRGSFEE